MQCRNHWNHRAPGTWSYNYGLPSALTPTSAHSTHNTVDTGGGGTREPPMITSCIVCLYLFAGTLVQVQKIWATQT